MMTLHRVMTKQEFLAFAKEFYGKDCKKGLKKFGLSMSDFDGWDLWVRSEYFDTDSLDIRVVVGDENANGVKYLYERGFRKN